MTIDEGGDPPCWAHLFDEETCSETSSGAGVSVAVDLGSIRPSVDRPSHPPLAAAAAIDGPRRDIRWDFRP